MPRRVFSAARNPRLAQPVKGDPVSSLVRVYDHWSDHPSKGLNPQKLSMYLANAETGDIRTQAELYSDILEKDLTVSGVFATRKLAVTQSDDEVIPKDGSGASGKKQAEFVADVLENLSDDHLKYGSSPEYLDRDGLKTQLLDSIPKGFSVPSLIWDLDGREWRPVAARINDAKHFTVGAFDEKDETSSLYKLRLVTDERPEGIPIDDPQFRYLFLPHFYQAQSAYPARAGLLRTVAWYYLFKNFGMKSFVIYSEIYGIPFRLGKYDPSSPEDKTNIENAVKNMGTDFAAVISKNAEISLLESGKTGSSLIHPALIEACNQEIAIGVLGQSATTMGTPGKLGAEEARDKVRGDIRRADSKALQRCIQRKFVAPLCMLNFGSVDCEYRIHYEDEEDLNSKATRYVQLSQLVPIGTDHIYEEFGVPKPKEDEPVTTPASQNPFALRANVPSLPRGNDPREGVVEDEAPFFAAAPGKGAVTEDGMNSNRKAASNRRAARRQRAIETAEELKRFEQAQGAKAYQAYDQFFDGIKELFASTPGVTQQDILDLIAANKNKVREAITLQLGSAFKTAHALAEKSMGLPPSNPLNKGVETAEGGEGGYKSRRLLSAGEGLHLADDKPKPRAGITWDLVDTQAADFLRFQRDIVAAVESEGGAKRIEELIKSGAIGSIEDGITFDEFQSVMNGVRDKMGVSEKKNWHAQTVFRTNLATAHSASRLFSFAKNSKAFPAWEYIAIVDARTRDEHFALDGRVFAYGDWRYWPPIDFNCRCVGSPISQAEYEEDNLSESMEPSADVPVESQPSFRNNAVVNFSAWATEQAKTNPAAAEVLQNWKEAA